MKKIIKVNDTYEIWHSHHNFQRQTSFVAYNKKTEMFNARWIKKFNDCFSWENPLTQKDIEFLIEK